MLSGILSVAHLSCVLAVCAAPVDATGVATGMKRCHATAKIAVGNRQHATATSQEVGLQYLARGDQRLAARVKRNNYTPPQVRGIPAAALGECVFHRIRQCYAQNVLKTNLN